MMELTQPCLDAMPQSEGFSQFLEGVFDACDEDQILTVTMDRCYAPHPTRPLPGRSGVDLFRPTARIRPRVTAR